MKKILIVFLFAFSIVFVNAQSDDMKELIRLSKISLEDEGFSVLEEWTLDINRYTGIGSEEQYFYGGTQYTAVLILDCSDCYPDLYFRKDGTDYETVQETFHESGLTMTVGIFLFDSDNYGQIVGLSGREAWYTAALIIFKN